MSNDLTARLLSEVEQAMEAEPHGPDCPIPLEQFCVDCGVAVCTCDRDQRLASRLARMLEAAVQWDDQGHDHALRAVAAAREAL